jgi:hypothetical protein
MGFHLDLGGGEKLTLHVVVKHAGWMNVGLCDTET